jgi:hypothetical protein
MTAKVRRKIHSPIESHRTPVITGKRSSGCSSAAAQVGRDLGA